MVVILNFKVKRFLDSVGGRAHTHHTVRQGDWFSFFVRGALLASVNSGSSSVNSRGRLLLNAEILFYTRALRLLVAELWEGLADFNLAPVLNFRRLWHIDEVVFLDLNFYVIYIVAYVALTLFWAFLPQGGALALVCFHLLIFCGS